MISNNGKSESFSFQGVQRAVVVEAVQMWEALVAFAITVTTYLEFEIR